MIAETIARLEAKAPSLVSVKPLEELDALSKGTAPASGSAFVLPYRERAEPNIYGMGGFQQIIHVQFLVAFILRKHDDASGGKKLLTHDLLKSEIEAAIAGWQVTEYSEPCALVAAQASPLGNGVTAYVQTWQTTRLLGASE